MHDDEILKAITALTATVNSNFRTMQESLAGIESRLEQQESKTRKMAKRQSLQEKDIEELKRIVLDLAENRPIKRFRNGAAISKEDAYRRFAGNGIGKVKATTALRDAGMLATDTEGKCTVTIRTDGKIIRVLLVTTEKGE